MRKLRDEKVMFTTRARMNIEEIAKSPMGMKQFPTGAEKI